MSKQDSTKGDKENNISQTLEVSYKQYYNLLYNYGMKLICNPDLVQDFIQDIFIKLHKREEINLITNLKVYLLHAMRNTVYDYYSSRKETISIDEMDFFIPEDDLILRKLHSKDDNELRKRQNLIQAIRSLSGQQKQILHMFYIKNLSHKEISEVLNISPQSSMNSLSKSIRKLRILFNQK